MRTVEPGRGDGEQRQEHSAARDFSLDVEHTLVDGAVPLPDHADLSGVESPCSSQSKTRAHVTFASGQELTLGYGVPWATSPRMQHGNRLSTPDCGRIGH
jgi:hypothetical protein